MTHAADMTGKVALVTGATSGIGLEIARGLAAAGATVLLHGRDPERLAAAVASVEATAQGQVQPLQADLARLAGVRALADAVGAATDHLEVLVHNAGMVTHRRQLTEDGNEQMLAVNHLAPFLLTERLKPLLLASAPARVVVVGSEAHRRARLDLDDLQSARRFSSYGTYGMTKLANLLFTRALSRRLTGTGVTANSCHPGVVATRFGQRDAGLYGLLLKVLAPLFLSPEKGARTPLWLATSPEVAGVTGGYFKDQRPVRPSAVAQDDRLADGLWEASARLCGLRQG